MDIVIQVVQYSVTFYIGFKIGCWYRNYWWNTQVSQVMKE